MLDDRTRRDADRAVRFVVTGQALFAVTMLACCALEPSWPALRIGLSYYGDDLPTVVPCVGGFALCIALSGAGLRHLRPHAVVSQKVRLAAASVLGLMVPIPLTPFKLDPVFDWLHVGAASVLFTAGLAVGGWLSFKCLADARSHLLFSLQCVAALTMLAAEIGLDRYMIPGELAFQLLFAVLLVRAITHVWAGVPGPAPLRDGT
jgi:hypothetical protein